MSNAVIPNMLVVAGPSGAGKTSFLEQLASAVLQTLLRSQLPVGSEHWPQLPAFKSKDFIACRDCADRSNLSLHYDLNNLSRFGGSTYEEEPTAGIVGFAERITLVNIRPSPERLKAQLALRCFGGVSPEDTHARRQSKTDLSAETRDKVFFLDCYDQPGWLDAQFTLWNDYVGLLRKDGRLVKALQVEPTGPLYAPGDHSWNLLEHP